MESDPSDISVGSEKTMRQMHHLCGNVSSLRPLRQVQPAAHCAGWLMLHLVCTSPRCSYNVFVFFVSLRQEHSLFGT